MTPAVGYTEMKDSGIPSFEMIPSHWQIYRFSNICKLRSENNSGGRELLSVYLSKGVIRYTDSTGMQVHKPSDSLEKYQNVYVGDFVMNNQQAWRGSVGVSKYDGIISPAYHVYELSEICLPQYMSYLLRDSSMVQQYELASRGVGTIQRNIYEPWLRKSYVALPPLFEQSAIAAYLDTQCAKIDEIIAEAKASIEDYKQWKASIIYEAVTKGLDPNAEMKDSGIEWIGEMPAGWRTFRIKNLGKARNGLTYSPENQVPEQKGTLVLRSSNIQNGVLDFSDNVYVDSKIPSELILEAGDILICSRNGSGKLIGKNAYIDVSGKYSFGAFMMSFRPVIYNTRYAYWILNSGVFNYYLPMFFTSTINQLTRENFRNMVIPYCDDKQIQKNIVEYLDKRVSQIDSAIKAKENFIFDLEAYKKSLIYEVVTGKRRVC